MSATRQRRSNAVAATGSRGSMWLLIASLVLLAMAALYVAMFSNDGVAFAEDDVESSDTEAAADDDAADAAAETLAVAPAGVTNDVFLRRDPFDPVVPEPVSTGGDGGTTDPGTTDPGTTDPGTTDPGSGGVCSGGTDEVVCEGQVLTLIGITSRDGEPRAVIQVDVNTYEVAEGQRFAERFELHRIGEDQVTVFYGDEVIVLRTGDRVLK